MQVLIRPQQPRHGKTISEWVINNGRDHLPIEEGRTAINPTVSIRAGSVLMRKN
jgi:hypothetical protein